jgi:hypothetical protein
MPELCLLLELTAEKKGSGDLGAVVAAEAKRFAGMSNLERINLARLGLL